VTLESDDAEYLYQVTATDLVHEDDLRLYGSEEATISLVTCYPRLRYDHRLIVTARLIGIKGKG
jgi:sortase (surface protein transpeptidase)